MGGSQSKAAIAQVQEQITNSAITISSAYTMTVTQTQSSNTSQFTLFGSNSNKTTQVSVVNFQQSNIQDMQQQLQTAVTNSINQTLSAKSIALIGALGTASTSAQAKIQTAIKSSLTISQISSTYAAISNEQKNKTSQFSLFGFNTNETSQGATILAQSVIQNLANQGVFTELESLIDQQGTATQENPLSFLADIFKGINTTILLFIGGFILIIILIFVSLGYVITQ